VKLYASAMSSNGKRVRVCAAELGVRIEPVVLDFWRGDNRSPDYLALNPMGMAPTLSDGGFVLWESAAILCHLAEASGGPLWPEEPRARADVLRWLFFCSCHLDPHVNTLVVERLIKARRGEPPAPPLTAHAEQALARFVPVVDQQVSGRDFVTGRFGLADIALGCTLELSPLLDLDLASYPNVRRWLERLQARPTWGGPSPVTFLDP
jgi:glutathione S-transferase